MEYFFNNLDELKIHPYGKYINFKDCKNNTVSMQIQLGDLSIQLHGCHTFRHPCNFAYNYKITENGFEKIPIDLETMEKIRSGEE